MGRGKLEVSYNGNRVTRKNSGCDRGSPMMSATDKKQGMGKFNWGRPGDEMIAAPVDRRDPIYDELDDTFEWDLVEHLKSPTMSPEPSPKEGNKVTWDDDFSLDAPAPLESVVIQP